MNPRFDIATGKVMSGHYFSAKSINQQPTPLVPKEKSHPHPTHIHHVRAPTRANASVTHTKHHKKHK